MDRYYVVALCNGYYRVYDRYTQTAGLYNRDGSKRDGYLPLGIATVFRLILRAVPQDA